ncbi:IclR family transcriptional regulator [Paenibacillus sp. 1P07SE]|uniref:IclR family transcriptional regulator n=1 Tax=Paenibacillus sp. 1P07SE TaxID=3132209 RepID=UPI0039A6A976
MERKYWVPALERAHTVLQCIAEQPSRLRLIDLTAATAINKSTMFSLLQTMETLGWVNRERGDTYSLGPVFAHLGNAYFSGFSLVELFMQKSAAAVERVGETLQLARLEGGDIVYLAKKEAPAQVRLLSEPGMRLPAYATAMGKAMLACLEDSAIFRLYEQESFNRLTPHTVGDVRSLLDQLYGIRERGYATDMEEVALGFSCTAAAVRGRSGEAVAAISFTMATSRWEHKHREAVEEIRRLAAELSAAL